MGTESGPDDWKKANVILIFTKGKEGAGNYRPVLQVSGSLWNKFSGSYFKSLEG